MQTLKDFIKEHYSGNQAEYARVHGHAKSSVSEWLARGCLVDSRGWPHPSLNKRNVTRHKTNGE